MKTAIYGMLCLCVGLAIGGFITDPLVGFVSGMFASVSLSVLGVVLEGWIVNHRFWEGDRYDRD